MRTVAALYVDELGPYVSMPGVDAWTEKRDARGYAGPSPVVAHPPCGPWGRLFRFCTRQDASLGPLAVEQVRRWGGVLEHPKASRLWKECGLPLPGELPDRFGGRTCALKQCDFGNVCTKPTWIYVVGCDEAWVSGQLLANELSGPGVGTHSICNGRGMVGGKKRASALQARLTPPAFAEFLVELARKCQPPTPGDALEER